MGTQRVVRSEAQQKAAGARNPPDQQQLARVERLCDCLEAEGLRFGDPFVLAGSYFVPIAQEPQKLPSSGPSERSIDATGILKSGRRFEIQRASTTTAQERAATEKLLSRTRRAMKRAELHDEPVVIGSRIFVTVLRSRRAQDPVIVSKPASQKRSSLSGRPGSIAHVVAEKLENPNAHPVMTVAEVAHALGRSKSTVYRMVDEGTLSWHASPGRMSTKRVKQLVESPTE